jgi:peptidase E
VTPREPPPLYLFADSSILFWKNGDSLFLQSILKTAETDALRAAYIGASNGDVPEYYEIFLAAMSGIGVSRCRMIRSSFSSEDEAFLNDADIVLLAGGDVAAGWKVLGETGMKEAIVARHAAGASIVGISAGAVQLGMYGVTEDGTTGTVFDTFKLCPLVIAAHDETNDWRSLRNAVRLLEGAVPGIGIPAGGGLVYHTDGSLEPVRRSAFHFSLHRGEVVSSLLCPVVDVAPPATGRRGK